MSATKRYWETVSEREGYGGELTEEFLGRVQAGEFRDTLLVIAKDDGTQHRFHETEPEFRDAITRAALANGTSPDDAERRLRAGEYLREGFYLRRMVCGGLAG